MDAEVRRLMIVAALVLAASPAFAQSRVRVTSEQATIWRMNFTIAAAVVPAGTELDVVALRGQWYEVELPYGPDPREHGLISVSQVEVIAGGAPSARPTPQARAQARRPPAPRDSGIRVFGKVGYEELTAKKSFEALLGSANGVWYGGGVEFRRSSAFFAVSLERFRKTGSRVYVFDNEAFPLGIPDTITLMPLDFTVGYRVGHGQMVPYVGGGLGAYFYKDESDFAAPEENVSRHFASYHALFGVELRGRWLASAFEFQYTHVHNNLAGGVADAYDEHDLGGIQARVKVLFGK
jgi:hypothetical protein